MNNTELVVVTYPSENITSSLRLYVIVLLMLYLEI